MKQAITINLIVPEKNRYGFFEASLIQWRRTGFRNTRSDDEQLS